MSDKKFYVTTPIYYVNGDAHLGHAYSTVIADVLARYARLKGQDTFFLTGTDEHGEKVAQAAKDKGKEPKAYCDEISEKWKELWIDFELSHDKFIRTTDESHMAGAKKAFETMFQNGDIYMGTYAGHYCKGCESYVTTSKLIEDEFCPDCERATVLLNEHCYKFKLSAYQDKLLKLYDDNPNLILPVSKRNGIIRDIKDGLEDLAVTRSSFKWGVKLPDSIDDPKHIMYVWIDALFNYVSGIGYGNDEKNMDFWPVDYHIIGKDILWFHAVYWPAFLMSVGLEPPKHIATHGWWTRDGQKMSKSKGNVVDPKLVADLYGIENFRYFMLREVPFGGDGDFSEKSFIERINSDLASGYGNLLNRIIGLSKKRTNSLIDSSSIVNFYSDELEELNKLFENIDKQYSQLTFHKLLGKLWEPLAKSDKLIQNLIESKETDKDKIMATLALVANTLARVSLLLHPVMPQTTDKVATTLGFTINTDSYNRLLVENGLLENVTLEKLKEQLIERVDEPRMPKPVVIEEKEGLIGIEDFFKVSLKVGKVIEAKEITGSSLGLQLQVDIGEDKPIQIIANIRKYYSQDEMLNSLVCVVANLKGKKVEGLDSQGMILAAKHNKKMTLIRPENDIKIGATIQ